MEKFVSQLEKLPLFQKATENALGFVLSLLLSIGLLGGSSYILFHANSDLESIQDTTFYFEKQSAEYSLGNQMREIWEQGWFFETPNNTQATISLIQKLEQQKNSSKLNDEFVSETKDWLADAIVQLTSEKGRISGFVFQDKSIQTTQANFLGLYNPYITMLKDLSEMVTNWEKETPNDREAQFNAIDELNIELLANYNNLLSHIRQLDTDISVKLDENQSLYEKAERNYKTTMMKIYLSFVGVVLGGTLLILIIVVNYVGIQNELNVKGNKWKKSK